MMSFNDFVKKYNLKNKTMSIIEIQKVFSSIGLDNVKNSIQETGRFQVT